jgi:hypothetical protein
MTNHTTPHMTPNMTPHISPNMTPHTTPNITPQNVCVPETRGTAFAFFNLADDLGKGAGPVLVVSLIKSCNGQRK